MDIKDIKKLEKKVRKPEFSEDYKSLNIILKILSFVGNISSIILASFFITQLLSVAISNPIIYWGIGIIALVALEMTKREIFFRFSRDFIRTNKIFTSNVLPMLIVTCFLISMSFYSSLSGAKEFTSKTEIIETATDEQLVTYSDSVSNYYSEKIKKLEDRNQVLFEQNLKYDEEASQLKPTWVSAKERIRNAKNANLESIDKNDDKIDKYKRERDANIEKYKEEITNDAQKDINKNEKDSFVFISISSIIEMMILIGIYFNNLYNFRSYRDIKKKLNNDDNYRKYYNYSELLEILFLNREERSKIPNKKDISKLLEMNKVYMSEREISDAITLFKALNIITEVDSDVIYISKEKNESDGLIKEHFNI